MFVTRKKMKNMILKIGDNGELIVHCPFHVKDKTILDFIKSKERWIIKALQKTQQKMDYLQTGTNMKTAMWFGKTYTVQCIQDDFDYLEFKQDTLIYHCRIISENTIHDLFMKQAVNHMVKEVESRRNALDASICKLHQLPYPKITLKYMTSRWGSCTPSKSRISLSTKLVHYPIECLQYVMVHEYAHLLVANHSKAFYDVVERLMPNYKKIVAIMK